MGLESGWGSGFGIDWEAVLVSNCGSGFRIRLAVRARNRFGPGLGLIGGLVKAQTSVKFTITLQSGLESDLGQV